VRGQLAGAALTGGLVASMFYGDAARAFAFGIFLLCARFAVGRGAKVGCRLRTICAQKLSVPGQIIRPMTIFAAQSFRAKRFAQTGEKPSMVCSL
jgi:hypothetical protein